MYLEKLNVMQICKNVWNKTRTIVNELGKTSTEYSVKDTAGNEPRLITKAAEVAGS